MRKLFLGMEDELLIVKETADGYNTSVHLEGTHPTQLAVNPQDSNIVYCATYGNGLWKSENGGENWFAIGKMNAFHEPVSGKGIDSAYITALALHPQNSNILYVGTEPSALYYSLDSGASFTEFKEIQHLKSKPFWQHPPRPHTNHIQWITPSFSNESSINVAIEFGALVNTFDHGNSWNDRPFLSPKDIHALLAHPFSPGRLYAACGDGLVFEGNSYAESQDEGVNWQYMSEGLESHPYLYSMAVNAQDSDDRLVSASRNAIEAHHKEIEIREHYSTIYRKLKDQPWQELSDGLQCEGSFIHQISADPIENSVFYALNNLGLFKFNPTDHKWMKLNVDWKEKYNHQHPSCIVVTSI